MRDRVRERRREGRREGEKERQHLTMMTIQPEHFNCMQTVSCIIEREREREREKEREREGYVHL